MIEDALDPGLTKRGLEATLETFKDRTGNKPDVTTGEGFDGFSVSRYMLFRDPAFEGILMAEKVLALVDYLIGDDCILSTLTGHMRGQGGGETLPTGYLPLHGDDTSPQPQAGIYNVTLAELFCRPHWQTYELYRETVTQEILDRNSDRFATLMGMDTMNGWNDNQDDWYKRWGDRDRSRYAPQTI